MSKPFHLGSCNSDYGLSWSESWCDVCKHDHLYHKPCLILAFALGTDAPPEHIYDEENNPICTAFEKDDDLENKWSDE